MSTAGAVAATGLAGAVPTCPASNGTPDLPGDGSPRTPRPRSPRATSPRTVAVRRPSTVTITTGRWCCPRRLGSCSTCFTRRRSRSPYRLSAVADRLRGKVFGTGTSRTAVAGSTTRAAAGLRYRYRLDLSATRDATTAAISGCTFPAPAIYPVFLPGLRRSASAFIVHGAAPSRGSARWCTSSSRGRKARRVPRSVSVSFATSGATLTLAVRPTGTPSPTMRRS